MKPELKKALEQSVVALQEILKRDEHDFIVNQHIVLDDRQYGVIFGSAFDHMKLMKRMISQNAFMFTIMEIAVNTVEKSPQFKKDIEKISHEILGEMMIESSNNLKTVN